MRKIVCLFFFCNITRTNGFVLEDCGVNFLDIEKNFAKTKFQTSLIRFSTVGAPRILDGIAKLVTVWEPFA